MCPFRRDVLLFRGRPTGTSQELYVGAHTRRPGSYLLMCPVIPLDKRHLGSLGSDSGNASAGSEAGGSRGELTDCRTGLEGSDAERGLTDTPCLGIPIL